MSSVGEAEHLVIAGAAKCATTSLFFFLSRHPAVAPATVKETRFFLDPDDPSPSVARYTEGVERYAEFFPTARPGLLRLEATPQYLTSRGCAARLAQALPRLRVLICLRDPVDRLRSAYRYGRQLGYRGHDAPWPDFVRAQLDDPRRETTYPPTPLALGLYARHLGPWRASLPRARLQVVFFEDLTRDPRALLQRIAAFASLDAAPLAGLENLRYNESRSSRWRSVNRGLMDMRRMLVPWTYRYPGLHGALRRTKHAVEGALARWQPADRSDPPLEPALQARLADYYREDVLRLPELLSATPPWPDFFPDGPGTTR